MMEDALYMAGMAAIPGLGAAIVRKVVAAYDSPRMAYEAIMSRRCGLLSAKQDKEVRDYLAAEEDRSRFGGDALTRLAETLDTEGIHLLSFVDEGFPEALHGIYNPPALLFYKGNPEVFSPSSKNVAMVGARKCSPYGKNVAGHFAKVLASHDVTIISGGAMGVDAYSHEGALAGNGRTVAVMGCGLDIIYPRKNGSLFAEILRSGGTLVSEYAPGVPAHASHFPVRNRIISGLSRAVIVVEAKKSSGSLITADMAVSDGKDVYVVPGNVLTKACEGNHWLLRQGAMILTNPLDLLDDYQWGDDKGSAICASEDSIEELPKNEAQIVAVLSTEKAIPMEQILTTTGLSQGEVHMGLLQLEMKGRVYRTATSAYILCL